MRTGEEKFSLSGALKGLSKEMFFALGRSLTLAF